MTFSIKNLVLGIAIFILTISVGVYGISTLYGKAPQYNDYCPSIINYEQCMNEGGRWTNYTTEVPIQNNNERIVKPVPSGDGYCNYDYTECQKELEVAERKYHRKVFLTALPLGIVIIALGAIVFGLESVGAGLMLGGVGIILYGVGGFWRFTEDWLKFVLSLVGLIIVIWIAYFWNKKIQGFGKRKK